MDELFDQIKDRLAQIADGNLFEEFVGFSLAETIPGFAPVNGPGDYGRDGEVPTDEGAAPITCTIEVNVIGNMTKTLTAYKKSGGKAKIAYVATSQDLSNRQKQNLRDKAEELGFTLGPIYDAEYFINELYRHADWRLKLLGVSGEIPALSKTPLSTRKSLDVPIIGRGTEIAALEAISGDILITGQPGSGKTYLADDYAKRHNGVFVISDNISSIANDIRKKTPDYLIIDDVHSKPELLTGLKHMRTELGLSFGIIGTSWTSDETGIQAAMEIGSANVVSLKQLTRDELLSVVNACGLERATNDLKREIINQSKGKPGLAITLSYLCIDGDWQKVFNGDSLYSLVVDTLKGRLGKDITIVLSFIALGGDGGIGLSKLSQISGMPIVEVKTVLNELAFGGILSIKDDDNVSLEPDALRYPLVRELFFAGPGVLSFEDYIEHYPSTDNMVETLLVTSLKGAELDSARVLPYLDINFSNQTWVYYGSLGEKEAEYVARNNKAAILAIPQPLLYRQPKVAIRELIYAAAEDHREISSYPNHPIRILKDWVEGGRPGFNNESIERRTELIKVIESVVNEGYSDEKIIGRAIAAALNPHYEKHETDPGVGKTISFIQGYLSPEDFKSMHSVRETANRIYSKLSGDEAFTEILAIVHDWVYNRQNVGPDYLEKIKAPKKEVAEALLKDLQAATVGHHLMQRHIRKFGTDLGIDIQIDVPQEYQVLFPYDSRSSRRETEVMARQSEAIKQLAKNWAKENLEQVAKRLNILNEEANATNTSYPNYLHDFTEKINSQVSKDYLIGWASYLLGTSTAMLTFDVAMKIAETEPLGYQAILQAMLDSEVHRVSAVRAILMHLKISDEQKLFDAIKPNLSQFDGTLDTLCLSSEISTENELFVLDNVDENAAVKICGGIAHQYLEKQMPQELREKWENAILGNSTKDYHTTHELKHLLNTNTELILPWFKSKLNLKHEDKYGFYFHIDNIAQRTIKYLSNEDKKELLSLMDSSDSNYSLVSILVDGNPERYKVLLANQEAKGLHLKPLSIYADNWVGFAQAAIDAGYTKKEIKKQSFHFDFSWSGNASDMWASRRADVQAHLQKTDSTVLLRIIGECTTNIDASIENAKRDERDEEVNGI
jgi:hypothetical protein